MQNLSLLILPVWFLKRNTAEADNEPMTCSLSQVSDNWGKCLFWKTNFFILCVSGHYISDVYDIKKQAWFTYNDLEVSKIQEAAVQSDRDRSGYIFFYMHK